MSFKNLLFLLFLLTLFSCGTSKHFEKSWKVRFLDEYIIPENQQVEGTKVGGLSGLDFDGKFFYAVCDLPSSPRIYKFRIVLKKDKIDTLLFEEVISIDRKENPSLFWDSEGLIYNKENNRFFVSSEGSIKNNKDPFIAELDDEGKLLHTFEIPPYFKPDAEKGLRNNGVFEGLSESPDTKKIWVANELPMKRDGGKVKLYNTKSPVRFTMFDKKSRQPEKQFAYSLDRLRKLPLLPFGWSGVSAILNYAPDKFFVLERAFSAGHGSRGMRVRLYEADAGRASNTLHTKSLRGKINKEIIPAEKTLIFDFNEIRQKLTGKIVDNLEGISFGPILPNGNQTLVVIADNNFSSWTPQLNQVILLELIPN